MSEAGTALAAWGGGRIVRFLKDRENAVYEVILPDGTRAALRLHRVGYQTVQAIQSELWWMQALARGGLAVPMPIETVSGKLVSVGKRTATVIEWVPGDPLGEAGKPLGGSPQERFAQFRTVGALVAGIHNATDSLTPPPGFTRHAWDVEGLLGERPFWGRFWENPTLSGPERDLVMAAREMARDRLLEFSATGGDYGLIHADVLRENVLFSGETVSIIDFDDCGFGFRLYDLATLASQNEDEPEYEVLMAAATEGYRSERALADADIALIPLFLMLRRFASCGWVVDRSAVGDPRIRIYAERAVKAAYEYLYFT